jgi:phosphate/sulfate permease
MSVERSAVRWGVGGNIVAAWLLTFPVCFALRALLALVFDRLF